MLVKGDRALLVSRAAAFARLKRSPLSAARSRGDLAALDGTGRCADRRGGAASLFDEVEALLGPALFWRGSTSMRTANGLAARGVDEEWWRGRARSRRGHRGDRLRRARALGACDLRRSHRGRRQSRARRRSRAKSAAFVPLLSEGDVVGVLVAATTASHRNFTPAELELVQGLASEAARARPARARTRPCARRSSASAAEIGRRVRARRRHRPVAVEATEAFATRSSRLGELGEPMPVLADGPPGSIRGRPAPTGAQPCSPGAADRGRRRRRGLRRDRGPEPRRSRGAPRTSGRDAGDSDRRLRPGHRQPMHRGDSLAPRRDRAWRRRSPGSWALRFTRPGCSARTSSACVARRR